MSTPCTQILISKYHFPLKKSGLFEKLTASVSGAGQTQVSLGNLGVPERKEILKINEVMSKGHRILLEVVPTGQLWNNLNIKKKMTVMD